MTSRTLDLGCGGEPKNPFNAQEVYGIDLLASADPRVRCADLAVERIPFPDAHFDCVSAFDFLEHVPRIVYLPHRRFCFVELMNEIHRVLKPDGLLMSFTPAFPAPAAFRDPTHVNIITEETFPFYFDAEHRWASMYGFSGAFRVEQQNWHDDQIHLFSVLRKVPRPAGEGNSAPGL